MNLKVLNNDLQFQIFEEENDSDALSEITSVSGGKLIPPVFNRVGFYMIDNKTAWYEFKLPSGKFVGYLSGKDWFTFNLDVHNADEHPISEKEWSMIKHLIKRGVIKNSKRYRDEEFRRERRRIKLDYIKL